MKTVLIQTTDSCNSFSVEKNIIRMSCKYSVFDAVPFFAHKLHTLRENWIKQKSFFFSSSEKKLCWWRVNCLLWRQKHPSSWDRECLQLFFLLSHKKTGAKRGERERSCFYDLFPQNTLVHKTRVRARFKGKKQKQTDRPPCSFALTSRLLFRCGKRKIYDDDVGSRV